MAEISKERKLYRSLFRLAQIVFFPFCRVKATGTENLPDGAGIICANHSSLLDPVVICFSLGRDRFLHILAKIELFSVPLLKGLLKAIGTIPVDRSRQDTSSIRLSLKYLKNGEMIGLFPEGTRVSEAHAVTAKLGAVKLAAKTGVPIIPMYIPRKKSPFRSVKAVIGAPYYIRTDGDKTENADYSKMSEELMDRIENLKVVNAE